MLLSIFVLAVFIFETFSSYKSEIKNAEIHSANLTQVLEEQISGTFEMIDLSLKELQDTFESEPVLSRKRSDLYNKWLSVRKSRLSEVLSFKVVNQDGFFVGDDRGIISDSNLADREYFQSSKKSTKNELIISKPLISKTASVWVVVLARPVLGAHAEFKGLLLATVPITHFQKIFSALNVGANGVITLYGFDRHIYARKPLAEDKVGKRVIMAPQMESLLNGNHNYDTYQFVSNIDKTNRILTARKLEGYPFVVVTGLAKKDLLVDWKLRTFIYLIFFMILFSVFVFFLLHFLNSLEIVEEQRKHAIQSAKLSSLGEMASGIAHEINNPLTIISGLAITLKRSNAENENDKKLNASLDRIIKMVDRIAKIIRGLRSFSRDSYNDPVIPTSVQKILLSTLDLCQERMINKHIGLKVTPFEDVSVMAREIQISQVVMNLLSNSMDALENAQTKWIKIDVTDLGKFIAVRVTDSGAKIDDKISSKIMQPFFTTKSVGKGTGLGLSISKGIITAHEGHFYLDNDYPNTSFVIELPKAQGH